MAMILDGKALAKRIREKLKTRVDHLADKPGLAVLLVGNDPASHTYVNIKQKACEEVGIRFEKFVYDADVSEELLLETIQTLNLRSDINGILVQLPLPSQNPDRIIASIDPKKDVDGFHPENVRALKEDRPAIVSAVALGVMRLISLAMEHLPKPTSNIMISSPLFAEPLIPLFKEQGMVLQVVSANDPELETKTTSADLIIVAIGKPTFLTGSMIKPGAILIDVGTTKIDGTLWGDVDRQTIDPIAGAVSPVPGGVGPMTVAMLLVNVLKAHQLQHGEQALHLEQP